MPEIYTKLIRIHNVHLNYNERFVHFGEAVFTLMLHDTKIIDLNAQFVFKFNFCHPAMLALNGLLISMLHCKVLVSNCRHRKRYMLWSANIEINKPFMERNMASHDSRCTMKRVQFIYAVSVV